MAKALGVGGVFFRAKGSNEELAKWYSEALGFEMHPSWGASFQPSAMPEGGMTVFTAFAKDTEYFAPANGAFMVNLVVDDLDGALAQVKAAGAELVGDVMDEEYGRFGHFLDPDGNKVELWEPAVPPASESE